MALNGHDFIVLDEVDSTNDELRRLLTAECKSQSAEGVDCACNSLFIKALVAHRQTQGKGRLGRSWKSPEGGLYLSLGLKVDALQALSSLSLVVALGVKKALEEYNTKQDILVKWPNDIYGDQGKLVGILIETVQVHPLQRVAITGIGINITRPSEGAFEHAGYLSDGIEEALDKECVAQRVIAQVLSYATAWHDAGCNLALLKDEYNDCLTLREKEVKATDCTSGLVVQGIAKGVDEQGYLLVDTGATKLMRVAAGEVTLRN